MGETKTVYDCGCIVKTVASGTSVAGTIKSYCDAHNPYRNIAPRVDIINEH